MGRMSAGEGLENTRNCKGLGQSVESCFDKLSDINYKVKEPAKGNRILKFT